MKSKKKKEKKKKEKNTVMMDHISFEIEFKLRFTVDFVILLQGSFFFYFFLLPRIANGCDRHVEPHQSNRSIDNNGSDYIPLLSHDNTTKKKTTEILLRDF